MVGNEGMGWNKKGTGMNREQKNATTAQNDPCSAEAVWKRMREGRDRPKGRNRGRKGRGKGE